MVTQRLPERRTAFGWIVAASLSVSIPVVVLGIVVEQDFGTMLGVGGVVLSYSIPYFMERRSAKRESKHVRLLSYAKIPFVELIYAGLKEELEGSGRAWHTDHEIVPQAAGAAAGLSSAVRTAVSQGVDALLVLPLVVDDEYWSTIESALAAGLEVVVLDVAPPRSRFGHVGTVVPYLVGADYTLGGQLLGQFIGQQLVADPTALAVLAFGPDLYFAGTERSRQALGELASLDLLDRTRTVPIAGWALSASDLDRLCSVVNDHSGAAWVYVAHDGNLRAVRDHLARHASEKADVHLLGYDGIPTRLGEVEAISSGLAAATIDVDCEEQGREAARVLIDVRRTGERRGPMSRIVNPKLITRDSI